MRAVLKVALVLLALLCGALLFLAGVDAIALKKWGLEVLAGLGIVGLSAAALL